VRRAGLSDAAGIAQPILPRFARFISNRNRLVGSIANLLATLGNPSELFLSANQLTGGICSRLGG